MKKMLGYSFLGILTLALSFAFTTRETDEGYGVGDVVEGFSLMNIDDTMVSLDDYENVNGYIFIFTCNTCPYAVMYEDRMIALHNEYAPQGFPIIAINPNDPEVKPGDSFDAMKVRAAEKEFPFKYLFDADQEIFPLFGATRTPHVYLADNDRVIRYIGAIDNNARDASAVTETYLADAIEALKAGDDPNPDFTKAIGCTIKVKS